MSQDKGAWEVTGFLTSMLASIQPFFTILGEN